MILQHELIRSLQKHGGRTAIEYGNGTLSYSAVLERANKITGFLLGLGLEKETIVGIQLGHRAELICTMIGILNARCVFVPVDGSLPDGRLSAMMENLEMHVIIRSRHELAKKGKADAAGLRTYFFEDILDAAQATGTDLSYPAYDGDDSIYIYFTSGSTGLPKGIVGRNKSLLQFLRWEISAFDLDSGIRVSQLISPYFDAFLRDVFVPLLAGGTLCIPPSDEDFFTADKLTGWIDGQDITLIHCVPSIFRTLNTASLTPEHFRKLEYILLSGEKIIPAALADWYKIFNSRIQLVNLYGTTETTMIRVYYKIRPEDCGKSRIPAGYPIDDTELAVLSKEP